MGQTMRFLAAILLIALVPIVRGSADLPAPLAERIDATRKSCHDYREGELDLDRAAVQRVDLDGDGEADWVVDEFAFRCPTAASLFCNTGGCLSHFLVAGKTVSFRNQGWETVGFGRYRVLLLDRHGSDCGGANPTPCVSAHVWDADNGSWRSVAEPPR